MNWSELYDRARHLFWKDWATWIGHGLQGVGWALAFDLGGVSVWWAVAVCGYHFSIREYNDFTKSDRSRKKLIDGVMDLATPFIGIGLYIGIKSLL